MPKPLTTRDKIQTIIAEMDLTHLERRDVVRSFWVAAIAHQHMVMIGPGGTAKSQMSRDFAGRIIGGNYFETQLHEATTPDHLLGPVNIKGMVEDGTVRHNIEGMLPTAHFALIDEVFNGNQVVLHALQDILNERAFHNGGQVVLTPLRSAVMGTNKVNLDPDMLAFWDRLHIRHQVDYVQDRDNLRNLLEAAVERKVSIYKRPEFTTITLEELDRAHDQAMLLPIADASMGVFLDLVEELTREHGVVISTRRIVEGLTAVLANSWLNGRSEVHVGDMTILRHMFWSRLEDAATVRNVILSACNPGEKAALEKLKDLDELKAELVKAMAADEVKKPRAVMEIYKRSAVLLQDGEVLREAALASGVSVTRIDDLIAGVHGLRYQVANDFLGLTPEQVDSQRNGRR